MEEVSSFNVIKGFLNLVIDDAYWIDFLVQRALVDGYGRAAASDERVVVEFASPNTNKPLHLGHVRNILLGWSTSQLLTAAGYDVKKVQIINDRGIAICKSMLAWERFGNGATPKSAGTPARPFRRRILRAVSSSASGRSTSPGNKASRQESVIANNPKQLPPEDFWSAYKNTYFNSYSPLGYRGPRRCCSAGRPVRPKPLPCGTR